MRKSFIVHLDSLGVLDDLSDEQCGELFRAIKAYHLGDEITLSPIAKIAFSPFKNQFARDSVKYEKLCEKNRLIAVNRHKNKATKSTTGNDSIPSVTKSTDNDNDNDSDSDSKKENNTTSTSAVANCPHHEIIDLYHEHLPRLPRVQKSLWAGSKRAKALQARWKQAKQHQNLEFWKRFFIKLNDVDYLFHGYGSGDIANWEANLGWILQRNKFDDLLEKMIAGKI